jgi:hypothetical protein
MEARADIKFLYSWLQRYEPTRPEAQSQPFRCYRISFTHKRR